MGLYRKKPVVIEARQIRSYLDIPAIAEWCGGVAGQVDPGPAFINIPTLEGVHRADVFDYVIKGVKGEFYPCKPDIFEMTYEPAEEGT